MANNNTYMVSSQYIKDNTIINNNTDNELIDPFILQAQNTRIERILGTALFNDIITNIQSGTITGLNKTLLDNYILPSLIQWVVYESMPYLLMKITNKSITKKSSDNSTPVEINDMKYLRENVMSTAQYYDTRMVQYLQTEVDNGNFDLYSNPGDDVSTITPSINTYFGGLYLKS